jgi:hypothetical protein
MPAESTTPVMLVQMALELGCDGRPGALVRMAEREGRLRMCRLVECARLVGESECRGCGFKLEGEDALQDRIEVRLILYKGLLFFIYS